MDLKLKTIITFTFESIENYEQWLEYNEGSPEIMRNQVLNWHKELSEKLNNKADNCLPPNYTIGIKSKEYWRP